MLSHISYYETKHLELEFDKLVSECIKGNSKAHEKLYELFASQMYSICLRYARCQDDADDIFQQGFLHVFEKLGQLRNPNALAGWVKSTFINTALAYGRKNYKDTVGLTESPYPEIRGNEVNMAISKMALEELITLVQILPEQYKKVFNLYIIDGYSHKEIAKTLGISVGTSKSNLHDARRIMKRQIASLEKVVVKSLEKE